MKNALVNNMRRGLAALLLAAVPLAGAHAHALLDHATPGVGATVKAAPPSLDLTFTEGVEPAFSGIELAPQGGARIKLGKPTGQGATLSVKLGRTLPPGTYVVHWHVVSTDTHHTSGAYTFTIAP